LLVAAAPASNVPSTFNARAETVAEKPMFRSAFKRHRFLISASGYYEWQNTPKGKQPYYYTARDGSLAFGMNGKTLRLASPLSHAR
jgi:putative SOS response-associated peptidase YedK